MQKISARMNSNVGKLVIGVVLLYAPLLLVHAQFDEASVTDCSDGNGQLDPARQWPTKDPKTGKIGLLGKPCDDTTASGKTYAGKCTALNFCKAETADKKPVKDAKEFEKETLKASSGNNDLQQIHKVSYDPGLQTDEVPTPSNEQSFLSRYGYTPETLENLQKMSEQGTNLQELFERGDYKMEHTGVPLQYDNQGRLTEETYKALEKNIGTLQDLPDGSQYSDHSGKPALWQPGAQATGWAGKGLGDVGQAQGFWERAWDGTKEFVGNFFGNNEEPQAGAFPEEPSLWKSAIETSGWQNEFTDSTEKELAGQKKWPGGSSEYLAEQRKKFFDELDKNPGLRNLVKRVIANEGVAGSKQEYQAVLEAMVNRAQMRGYASLEQAIRDGFYGPVNRGIVDRYVLTPSADAIGEQSISAVRGGSNLCNFCTDQGLLNEIHPNGRIRIGDEYFGHMAGSPKWANTQRLAEGVYNSSNLSIQVQNINWSAYAPLDLSYSLAPPQLAASAPEFEVPGPYAPALVQEYQIPGPFAPALITEYQTGGYDIPTFYADYAAPEPIPAYPSGVEFTGQPAPGSTGVGAVPYPDGAAFTAQPEPDEEHSQARKLIQGAIDRGQDWYQSVNDGLQALWDQEVTRRIAGDFNMADNEWPLTATEEAFAHKEAVRAAETEREADKAKWHAAYEQLVNTYQDPIGEFSESAVTAKDIERAYDDSARTNDPNHLTPSDGVRPEVADNEQAPTPDQKQSLEKAIADARDELSKAETKQGEPTIVEVKKPRGADAKTLAEWYKENDKQLSSREQRAADYDASLAGCGSGTYRGTACQNAWLLKRYQDESWNDALALAAARSRVMVEPAADTEFDGNLIPVPRVQEVPVVSDISLKEGLVPTALQDAPQEPVRIDFENHAPEYASIVQNVDNLAPEYESVVETPPPVKAELPTVSEILEDPLGAFYDTREWITEQMQKILSDEPTAPSEADDGPSSADAEHEQRIMEAERAALEAETKSPGESEREQSPSDEKEVEVEKAAAKEAEEKAVQEAQKIEEEKIAAEKAEKYKAEMAKVAQEAAEQKAREEAAQKTKSGADKVNKAVTDAKGALENVKRASSDDEKLNRAKTALGKVEPVVRNATALLNDPLLNAKDKASIKQNIDTIKGISKTIGSALDSPTSYAIRNGISNAESFAQHLGNLTGQQMAAARNIVLVASNAAQRYVVNRPISGSILTNTPRKR